MNEDITQPILSTIYVRINGYVLKNVLICVLIASVTAGAAVFYFLKGAGDYSGVSSNDLTESAATDTGLQEVKVDLSGAVRNPGVYTLNSRSRISDLLALGGGFTSDVSALWVSKNLNMSENVKDGQKVYIPFEWDVSSAADDTTEVRALALGNLDSTSYRLLLEQKMKDIGVGTNSSKVVSTELGQENTEPGLTEMPSANQESSSLVNINLATTSELDELPGIGPAYAAKISANRPYLSFDDFKESSGIPKTVSDNIKNLIKF